jgi:chromosome segregation ATPase
MNTTPPLGDPHATLQGFSPDGSMRNVRSSRPPTSPHPVDPKLSKKARQRKGEYLRKLEEDNKQLKDTILQFEQKIATIQAQNDILSQQLEFFQGHLAGDGPPPPDPEMA